MTSSTTLRPPFPAGTIENFFPKTPFFFLSNFFPSTITYEGITYKTVEHAYQAAKTEDVKIRKVIADLAEAKTAKYHGKSLILRPQWDVIKFDIMYELLKLKFVPGETCAILLLRTDNNALIEGNYWHDLVWGQCFCPRHNWAGSNRLGGLLETVRGDLRHGNSGDGTKPDKGWF